MQKLEREKKTAIHLWIFKTIDLLVDYQKGLSEFSYRIKSNATKLIQLKFYICGNISLNLIDRQEDKIQPKKTT